MHNYLDFEKPIAELEGKIEELRHQPGSEGVNIADQVSELQAKVGKLLAQTYAKLTPWQKTQVARHHDRPHALDYVTALIEGFTPLAGDRQFAEDPAVIGGLGRFNGASLVVIGTEKGADTDGRVKHNFGMARPEGYRKAQRLMRLAERFGLPAIPLIDTPGAYPGVDAEARGQAEAIARNLRVMSQLKVPIIATVVGEGGSGGALAIGVCDHLQMLEFSTYSVISPEGCASILWRSADKAPEAAAAMGLTAGRLHELGIVDQVIKEPLGGAHRDYEQAADAIRKALVKQLDELKTLEVEALVERRYDRLMSYGNVVSATADE